MSGGQNGAEEDDKPHDPSPHRLAEARRKGEVPKSNDLIITSAYAGLLLAGLAAGAGSLPQIGAALAALIARADLLAEAGSPGLRPALRPLLADLLPALAPWVLLPMGLALVAIVAQRAFTVAPQKLRPKLSRISVLSNAKNKFGRSGLFEFAKSFAKLAIHGTILGLFLAARLPEMIAALRLEPGQVVLLLFRLMAQFLAIAIAVTGAIGAVDFLFQRAEHLRRHRMSRKELTDEQKEQEGDPQMKAQRRQKAQEIALNQMLADVPKASVVVTNPTHYAVALQWDRGAPGAPVCLAKGVDEVAARIRRAAIEAGVPLHPDPPTARALHAMVEIGQEICPEHYAAVAIAIRFAEEMRRKARATGRDAGRGAPAGPGGRR